MEIDRQFFIPRSDAAEVFQPAYALFDHASAAVSFAIKFHRRIPACLFIVLVRDDRLNALSVEPVTQPLDAVSLVAGKLLRLVSTPAFLTSPSDQTGYRLPDYRLGERRFMHLSARHLDGKRSALTVSDQVEFRSKPTSAAAQRVVRRFVGVTLDTFLQAPAAARVARTLAPSTHQSSQSIRPHASNLTCNISTTAPNTPSRRHRQKYRCTVLQEPNRSGRSRQGAPVPRIQKMPSSINRRSFAGRPVRARLRGIRGAISSHCTSVSSCRLTKADLHVVMESYRQTSGF